MITLSPDNFDENIKEGTVLVKFAVKNGCRPCDEFKPRYEIFSQNSIYKCCEYAREKLPTKDEDLDEIEKKYKITSFPTVLLFENGENKGSVQRYKFFTDRDLAGMILDEQKKLYNQQCFVEDLQIEMNLRRPAPVAPEPVTPEKWTKKK